MNNFEAAIEITKIEFERLKRLKQLDSLDVGGVFRKVLSNIDDKFFHFNEPILEKLEYDARLNIKIKDLRYSKAYTYQGGTRNYRRPAFSYNYQIKKLENLNIIYVRDLLRYTQEKFLLLTRFQSRIHENLLKSLKELGINWRENEQKADKIK